MKTKKEFAQFSFDVKAVEGDKGIIEGYGSVFGNVDSYNDVMVGGCFKKSLAKKPPALLLHHDSRQPAGIWTEAREDDKGLYLRGELNMDVQASREAFYLAKQGALKGLSIGFITLSDEIKSGVRYIKEVDLWEVSMVTFPANTRANLTAAKAGPKTERELEAALRELGYGQNQAKAIIAKGFKGFMEMQRDADSLSNNTVQRDADEIVKQLRNLTNSLKG